MTDRARMSDSAPSSAWAEHFREAHRVIERLLECHRYLAEKAGEDVNCKTVREAREWLASVPRASGGVLPEGVQTSGREGKEGFIPIADESSTDAYDGEGLCHRAVFNKSLDYSEPCVLPAQHLGDCKAADADWRNVTWTAPDPLPSVDDKTAAPETSDAFYCGECQHSVGAHDENGCQVYGNQARCDCQTAYDRELPATTTNSQVGSSVDDATAIAYAVTTAEVAEEKKLSWCATHNDVCWLYDDGSIGCYYNKVVERDDGDCVAMPLPLASADSASDTAEKLRLANRELIAWRSRVYDGTVDEAVEAFLTLEEERDTYKAVLERIAKGGYTGATWMAQEALKKTASGGTGADA